MLNVLDRISCLTEFSCWHEDAFSRVGWERGQCIHMVRLYSDGSQQEMNGPRDSSLLILPIVSAGHHVKFVFL